MRFVADLPGLRGLIVAFALLMATLGATLGQARPVPTQDHWVIVIDTLASDRTPGDVDLNEGQAIARLERQFPSAQFALIRADSNEEVRARLRGFASNTVLIDGLYIMSHGSTMELQLSKQDRLLPRGSQARVNQELVPVIANEKEMFYVELNNRESLNSVFEPIRGRFARNAKIIFAGCKLMEKGSHIEKLLIMKQIAENFGLGAGSIYMNATDGMLLTRSAFAQPFYAQATAREKLVTLILQSTWVISLPILYFREHHRFNQGYTYRKTGSGHLLFEDDFFNAEIRKLSIGERSGMPVAVLP